MSIDRIDWHWDSAEEQYREKKGISGELTEEQQNEILLLAGNHIGLFLRWIIERGLQGEAADEDSCREVLDGRMSGTEYLVKCCDGKLWNSDICEEVRLFVEYYYDGSVYFKDYADCCLADAPCYGIISGEEDYRRLCERIDSAYESFKK